MDHQKVRMTFQPSATEAVVDRGTTVAQAARAAGVMLALPCGGLGVCGRCKVTVEEGGNIPTEDETVLLTPASLARGVRLACRTVVEDGMVVRLHEDEEAAGLRVVVEGIAAPLFVEPPRDRGIIGDGRLLGVAVDIGTTTVVVTVVDLLTGDRLGSASALNPQHPLGHDVMSRIGFAAGDGVAGLRELIVGTVESLIDEAAEKAGRPSSEIREIALAGNTTMIHFLLGIDPAPLGTAPYGPAFVSAVQGPAGGMGLTGHSDASAYVLPASSAFIGGDVVAGLLATGLAERQEPALFIDLGTNGEIVLRSASGLTAASTAAGPALEGASIVCGMRAAEGAVERVGFTAGGLTVGTIGDVAARGLCGSGLLDLIAVMLDAGALDPTGRILTSGKLADRVKEVDGIRVFDVADGVHLTQKDVRQVQLAVAAVSAGVGMLLETAGTAVDDVAEVLIAGGFGLHVSAEALVRIGMIPPRWRDRVTFVGNTALTGTLAALLDSEARRGAEAIARHIDVIDLATRDDFQERFLGAMTFPGPEGTHT